MCGSQGVSGGSQHVSGGSQDVSGGSQLWFAGCTLISSGYFCKHFECQDVTQRTSSLFCPLVDS